ncbi:hypothetical protein Ngar_c10390 [Candidatus Nitrososphaera gargensis Ga9.2]|uniref:Uncharacterized protein n=1 Tax=Nitrososphaera gargensis (strain Ga9.2) TaxID=1237085 RepID=K0I9F8_NITGG|nr:hypothetical protein Ngar_c10390 [Candidatus Nitrososphaera gargensis Ga9.2]
MPNDVLLQAHLHANLAFFFPELHLWNRLNQISSIIFDMDFRSQEDQVSQVDARGIYRRYGTRPSEGYVRLRQLTVKDRELRQRFLEEYPHVQ